MNEPREPGRPPPHSLARSTFFALQADVVAGVSDLVLAIVVARGLGPANRGVYFLALFAATLIALVGNMGLAAAALVYGASQRLPLAELHGMAIVCGVVVGALGAALLLGLQEVLTDSVLRGVDGTILILVSVSLAPLIYAQVVGALITGMGHVPEISKLRIAVALATPALTIPAVVLGDGEPLWPVAAWLVVTIGFATALARLALRHMARPCRPSRATTGQVVSFAVRGHVGTLAHQGFLRVDVLFISARLGPASVGLYAQASVLAERMSTLGQAMYASSAARLGSDPPRDAALLTAELVRVLLLVMVPVAALLAASSHLVMVVLFGNAFAPAALPFAILLPGTVCLTLWYVVSLYVLATLRRPGATTIIQGAAFIVSVPLYILAIDKWGLNGAALVSSVVYAAVFAAGLSFLLRSPDVRAADLIPRRADVRHMTGLGRQALAALPGR